jgi:outer membrane lipoprotein-sorting protein
MKLRRCATVALACLLTGSAAAETARDILDRRKHLEDTERRWNDAAEHVTLRIHGRGSERVREVEIYDERGADGVQKTIAFFLAPVEVKGTGFLAISQPGAAAQQRLYLPELQRTRQISPRMRDESFVGSDLSYRDLDLLQQMSDWTERDAKSALLSDETVDGVACHAIALAPQRDDIGYGKIVLWLAKDDLVPRRIEFWEADDRPKKRLTQTNVRAEGKIPVAHTVTVETPASETSTTMEVSGVRFDQGLEDDLFSERALERGRR